MDLSREVGKCLDEYCRQKSVVTSNRQQSKILQMSIVIKKTQPHYYIFKFQDAEVTNKQQLNIYLTTLYESIW